MASLPQRLTGHPEPRTGTVLAGIHTACDFEMKLCVRYSDLANVRTDTVCGQGLEDRLAFISMFSFGIQCPDVKPARLADGGISKDSSTGQSMRMCHKEANMRGNSIFYIIGVIVVVVFVLKFLGLW